jgi:hypothetical protein
MMHFFPYGMPLGAAYCVPAAPAAAPQPAASADATDAASGSGSDAGASRGAGRQGALKRARRESDAATHPASPVPLGQGQQAAGATGARVGAAAFVAAPAASAGGSPAPSSSPARPALSGGVCKPEPVHAPAGRGAEGAARSSVSGLDLLPGPLPQGGPERPCWRASAHSAFRPPPAGPAAALAQQ